MSAPPTPFRPYIMPSPHHTVSGLGSLEAGLGHLLGVRRGSGLAGDSQRQQEWLAGLWALGHERQLLLLRTSCLLKVGLQHLALLSPLPEALPDTNAEKRAPHSATEKTVPLGILS